MKPKITDLLKNNLLLWYDPYRVMDETM